MHRGRLLRFARYFLNRLLKKGGKKTTEKTEATEVTEFDFGLRATFLQNGIIWKAPGQSASC
jgi:hypothetical protein